LVAAAGEFSVILIIATFICILRQFDDGIRSMNGYQMIRGIEATPEIFAEMIDF
jgi:hypothetical protein